MEDIYGYESKNKLTTEKDTRSTLNTSSLARSSIAAQQKPWGIIQAPKEVHTRLRRGFASIFTTTALLQQEAIVQSQVDQLVAAFSDMCNEASSVGTGAASVDVASWAGFFSLDVISFLVLGHPYGCLKAHGQGRNVEEIRSMKTLIHKGAYEQAAGRLVGGNSILQPWVVKMLAPRGLFQSGTAIIIQTLKDVQARLADGKRGQHDYKDIIYHVLTNNEDRHLLSDAEIELNLVGFIVAGGETVGLALSLWAYCIGTHRAAYVTLRDLIRATFSQAEEIKWAALKDLPYLSAVINETCRYFFTLLHRTRVVPEGGMSIDGHFVPGGTVVAVAEYAANHSVDNFQDPFVFKPERWLDPHPTDNLLVSKPFAYGPRDCLGKNLAGIELRLAIAHLVWHFDLEIEPVEGEGAKNWAWNPKDDFKHIKAIAGPVFPPLWFKLRKVVR